MIAGEQQQRAGGERVAAARGHGGDAQTVETAQEAGAVGDEGTHPLGGCRHLGEIETGAELPLAPGDQQCVGAVGLGAIQRLVQCRQGGRRDGVGLAVVHRDHRHTVVEPVADG